eukprot:3271885-Rhodomonas_salina.2
MEALGVVGRPEGHCDLKHSLSVPPHRGLQRVLEQKSVSGLGDERVGDAERWEGGGVPGKDGR